LIGSSADSAGNAQLVTGILDDLRAVGVPASSVEVTRPTLDDVFLTWTGGSLRDGGVAAETTGEDDDIKELVEV